MLINRDVFINRDVLINRDVFINRVVLISRDAFIKLESAEEMVCLINKGVFILKKESIKLYSIIELCSLN